MTRLATGLLVRWTTQTLVPRRLLQPVTRRRLATVAAVQPKTTLQFCHAGQQRHDLGTKLHILRHKSHMCGVHRGRCVVSRAVRVVGRYHRHVELVLARDLSIRPIKRATWAVTPIQMIREPSGRTLTALANARAARAITSRSALAPGSRSMYRLTGSTLAGPDIVTSEIYWSSRSNKPMPITKAPRRPWTCIPCRCGASRSGRIAGAA